LLKGVYSRNLTIQDIRKLCGVDLNEGMINYSLFWQSFGMIRA